MLFLVVISFSSFRRSAFQKISKNRCRTDPPSREATARQVARNETDESKPNSRMIKTRMMGVTLMTSVIDKKSPRPGCRAEHRATDLRWRTRKKRPSLSLGRLDLSSCYFLKRSKIDISQTPEIPFEMY